MKKPKQIRYIRPLVPAVLLVILLIIFVSPAAAMNYEVNSINDDNDGVCDVNHCSLREAIRAANGSLGLDVITFNISGPGPHTIQPGSALPTISDPVIIDGYTQPEAIPNTNGPGLGNNAVLMIELDGSVAGYVSGLDIQTWDSEVKGLVINRFRLNGISIAQNENGIVADNVVAGNFIGTDVTGAFAPGPGASRGVSISGASNNTVGGTTPAASNIISGNVTGVDIRARIVFGVLFESTGNLVQGNFIGADATGRNPLGNTNEGVRIGTSAPDNLIGGSTAGAGNLISGNGHYGVVITTSPRNLVQGNFIGTDVTGTFKLGNGSDGISLGSGVNNTLIGGMTTGAGNVISGNGLNGIVISVGSLENLVQVNFIGTDVTGALDLGNGSTGLAIFGGDNSTISNVIVGNGANGVYIWGSDSTGNLVESNSIFDNGGLGIDLAPSGVTLNDLDDPDLGPNNLQNFPVLTSAASKGAGTLVAGTLNSQPNTSFRLEFFASSTCDPTGYGEGELFLGSYDVTADGNGDASFSVNYPAVGTTGQFITATATDPDNNTSEFSRCVEVIFGAIPVTIDIKPGSDPNSIDCDNEKGVFSVAILSTGDFDALTVDHNTVIFEGASETHVNKKSGEPRRHEEDVDGDGDTDLEFHFRQGETDLTCESSEGVLTGETFSGQAIIGTDSVRMVSGS